MAAKLFQFLTVVLAVFQSVWADREDRPAGCNIPENLSPLTLLQMRGAWYLQGNANTTVPPTIRCVKIEFFVRDNGRRGLVLQTYFNSNGIYNSDPIFVNYIRPGVTQYNGLRDANVTIWDYVIESDENSYLITACFVRNGETFQQTYGYITRDRTVPQQTIIDALGRAGVEPGRINFINQTNCSN